MNAVSRRELMRCGTVLGAGMVCGAALPIADCVTRLAMAQGRGSGRTPVRISPDNPAVVFNERACSHCGRCEATCVAQGVLRSLDASKLRDTRTPPCTYCGQCTNQCRRSGITERIEFPQLRELVMAKKRSMGTDDRILIASTSPAVRVALGESFGDIPGTIREGRMVTALRKIGFQYVLDTTFAADLTVMEEAAELNERLEAKWNDASSGNNTVGGNVRLPMFTSCCPGWVAFLELFYPELLPHLSSVKSPVMMQGAIVKTWFAQRMGIDPALIMHVAITPCTAKKFEVRRPELNTARRVSGDERLRDVDWSLTCRETAAWIAGDGVQWNTLADGEFDSMMGRGSGGGVIFGSTGGVMEATLRTTYHRMTGEMPPAELFAMEAVHGLTGVKEATVRIGDRTMRVAAVNGTGNVRPLLDAILSGRQEYDFVEVMACPGGCVGGGGQPKPGGNGRPTDALRAARSEALHTEDRKTLRRCSFQNPEIQEFYADFAGEPLSDTALALLHTSDATGE